MARTAFLILSLVGLAACDPFSGTLVAANMATLIHGDKTLPDYVFSSQTKKNCSLLHAARNEEYCQDAPPSDTEALAALSANRYCYRTLGGIDCYDRPDFLASGQTRVNFAAGGYLPDRNGPVPLELRDANGLAMAGLPAPVSVPSVPVPAEPAPDSAAPQAAAPGAPIAAAKSVMAGASGATNKTAKPAARTQVQASLNPPPPAAKPTKAAELAQVPLLRAPEAKVAPLADLPGQGTY